MTPDCELLRHYAETASEQAFAELVRRHVNLVYSAALRQVNGDAHLAQDVAQTVFSDLARQATRLSRRATLTGWLYTSAHHAATKVARTENRRRNREEQFMREPPSESAPPADWETLRPVLDDAMHELKETDREAVLLRYFENQPFADVGARLGLNDNAARMRVDRALEKLRGIFAKRGIATTTAFATVLSTHAVQLAPAGLVTTLTTASLAGAGTGTFTLLKIMAATQFKIGVATLAVAGTVTAMVVQHQSQEKLLGANAVLEQQIAQLQTDNQSLSNRLAGTGDAQNLSGDQFNELLKLRGEVGLLRQQLDELGKLRAENGQMRQALAAAPQTLDPLPSPEQSLFDQKRTAATYDAKMICLAMHIWADDNTNRYPTDFESMTNELGGVAKEVNFKEDFELMNVGGVDEHYPQMLVLREITPRQSPDGKWERVYGLADGSVHTITSPDGNFDAWEKAQTQYNPPPNQNP